MKPWLLVIQLSACLSTQDKRTGEAGYEARLRKAEEHVSAIAAAAEARSQAKMLAEVERYKVRSVIIIARCALG